MSFVSTFNHTNSMTDITFTRSEIESIMNGLLDTQNVLNRVDYECDNTNPKNVEKTVGFFKGFERAVFWSLKLLMGLCVHLGCFLGKSGPNMGYRYG